MSSSSSGVRQKMRDLKQVVPLAIPKESAEPLQEEVIEDGVKIFRKTSLDEKTTIYLYKVEYQDLGCDTDAVEGFVTCDSTKLSPGESLYVALVGRFRYGREEDEVLGMSLCREMYMGHKLVWAKGAGFHQGSSSQSSGETVTSSGEAQPQGALQTGNEQPGPSSGVNDSDPRLPGSPSDGRRCPEDKAKVHFSFVFPEDAPVSTIMQRLTPDAGDTCGVRYYVRCYGSVDLNKEHSTISVLNFPIRKLQFGSPVVNPSKSLPKGTILKEFPLNGGRLALEATLNKAAYEHGEAIRVKISLVNSSHKSVKHVKVTVQQSAQVHLWNTGKLKVTVASTNNRSDCHVSTGQCAEKEVILLPKAGDNKNKYGVFIQGREDDQAQPPCLASSTIVSEEIAREGRYFGIIVDYEVKVKLCLAALSSLSGFRSWMCNGVKGLVDDKAVSSTSCLPGNAPGGGANSPVSSPTKAPSTPAERRGEIACLIPFQIYQRAPTGNEAKSHLLPCAGPHSIEQRVEEIALEE
ncbi:phosrestin-2-like isoform X2 [Varroa jacobsoni]|uniref:Arrestin C-terminal-like domain-containing protein n=1 Tax=Varroa destructor TaxID=109461 RepID=A0A7M7K9L9_VARDE|nr:phosrestin-2-like isoform X2 [Varroa destructor]XP_022695982.1 phosrestin-2-like isoform X2 [Varroa jacobsoni]